MQKYFLSFASAAFGCALSICQAQVGDENPGGVAGPFNPMAGEGFDPATGAVRRQVTDLVVPGSVGAFPLAFTRMVNSRLLDIPSYGAPPPSFGKAGTWRHSYEWSIDPTDLPGQYAVPNAYNVSYPDGRRLSFSSVGGYHGPAGIPDYLTPLPFGAGDGSSVPLFLPDGSRVDFEASRDVEEVDQGVYVSHFSYRCTAIVDPYGRSISLSDDDGTALTVSEPSGPRGGGRSLLIVYRTIGSSAEGRVGDRVVSYVQEYLTPQQPGRRVDYDYASYPLNSGQSTSLVGVRYFGDSSLTAAYTYQANNYQTGGRPLIATCDDSMYAGRMKRIGYDFVPGGADGVLLREKAFDGTFVTILDINGNNRTVTRGDGPSRSLTYSGGFLVSQTDYRPAPDTATSSQHFSNGYVDYSIDPRTYRTDSTHNTTTGKLTSVTFPLTPSDGSGPRGTIAYGYDPVNPFYQARSNRLHRRRPTRRRVLRAEIAHASTQPICGRVIF